MTTAPSLSDRFRTTPDTFANARQVGTATLIRVGAVFRG
jgi:hypothetical protein